MSCRWRGAVPLTTGADLGDLWTAAVGARHWLVPSVGQSASVVPTQWLVATSPGWNAFAVTVTAVSHVAFWLAG